MWADSYKPMKKNYSNEKTENSKRDSSFYPGIDSAILKRDAECARKPRIRSVIFDPLNFIQLICYIEPTI